MELLHKSFPPYLPKKGEEYMSPKQRAHFKKVLEALKVELIGLKRLEARPTATLCIDCKTLDELREKQVAK